MIFMKFSSFMFQTLAYEGWYPIFVLFCTYVSFGLNEKWTQHEKEFWEFNLGLTSFSVFYVCFLVFIFPLKVFSWKRPFQDALGPLPQEEKEGVEISRK